jgi:hypothetical protein
MSETSETLGERLPLALERIGRWLGTTGHSKIREFAADVMSLHAAASQYIKLTAEVERLQADLDKRTAELEKECNALATELADSSPPEPITDEEVERLLKTLLCLRCKGRGFYLRDDGSDQGEQMDCPDCEAAQIRRGVLK